MPLVTVKLVANEKMGDFYFTKNQEAKAKELLKSGAYTEAGSFFLNEEGEAAAEEIFDMTNNPGRQYEREKYYGRKRSLSVGDIVNVDGADWLCCSMGWWKLP